MSDLKKQIDELFQDKKMSVYDVAKQLNVREYEILQYRGDDEFKEVGAENLMKIFEEVSTWGEMLFIKNTPEFIIEIKVSVPMPKKAKGFLNFTDKSGFLGGHLKEDAVCAIGFVSTKFMGFLGHSLHFYDADHNVIFKLFVNRNEKMKLDEAQEQKFLALKNSF